MSTVLEMTFKNEGQRNFTISLNDPREDITGAEVKTAMDNIVDRNIFSTTAGDIVEISAARIINKQITELDLE